MAPALLEVASSSPINLRQFVAINNVIIVKTVMNYPIAKPFKDAVEKSHRVFSLIERQRLAYIQALSRAITAGEMKTSRIRKVSFHRSIWAIKERRLFADRKQLQYSQNTNWDVILFNTFQVIAMRGKWIQNEMRSDIKPCGARMKANSFWIREYVARITNSPPFGGRRKSFFVFTTRWSAQILRMNSLQAPNHRLSAGSFLSRNLRNGTPLAPNSITSFGDLSRLICRRLSIRSFAQWRDVIGYEWLWLWKNHGKCNATELSVKLA